jgi:hypothetical protein
VINGYLLPCVLVEIEYGGGVLIKIVDTRTMDWEPISFHASHVTRAASVNCTKVDSLADSGAYNRRMPYEIFEGDIDTPHLSLQALRSVDSHFRYPRTLPQTVS